MRLTYKKIAAVLAVGILVMGCAHREEKKAQEKKNDTVLTILVQQSGTNMTGTWEGKGAEKLYEDTGIRLEFYSNGNGEEKRLKQYLAAGTLPDIIGFRDMEQAELLMGADVLLNLDEQKEVLTEVFETPEYRTALRYYRENYGGEQENLYFLPTSVGKQDENEYFWMPMMQWNAYEKAEFPKINTLGDYLNAAEQMREKKAMTALGDPVYGFSLCGDWSERKMQQPSSLLGLYGMEVGTVSPLIAVDAQTDTIHCITEEDSPYKQALHFYFEANQRKLLDPDSGTQSFEKLQEKYETGQILFSGYDWQTGGYGDTAEEGTKQNDSYIPILAEDMKIYKDPDNPVGGNWFFAVNKNSEKGKQACTLLNWLYTPENIAYLYQEKEGSDWYSGKNERAVFQWLGLTKATVTEKDTAKESRKEISRNAVEGSQAVYMMGPLPVELRKTEIQIQEMVETLSWEMIYAEDEETFEQLWSEMVQKSAELGGERLNEYYQQEWKEALKKEQIYGTIEK